MSKPNKNDIIKWIRETHGISVLDAQNLLESIGATERTPTKREMFAAMAMQGLSAAKLVDEKRSNGMTILWSGEQIAEAAVNYADALLAELERTK